jgi:hypothetical protein
MCRKWAARSAAAEAESNARTIGGTDLAFRFTIPLRKASKTDKIRTITCCDPFRQLQGVCAVHEPFRVRVGSEGLNKLLQSTDGALPQ